LNLHHNNKKLGVKAELVDKKIAPVYQYCTQQSDACDRFAKELKLIPEINQNIEKIRGDIEFICSKIDQLETVLSEQTELVAIAELQNWKDSQTLMTQRYQQRRQHELDDVEQELRIASFKIEQQRLEVEKLKIQERLNEQMIKAREKERQDRLREQQLLLEQAKLRQELQQTFQKEIDHYKTYGQLPGQKKEKKEETQKNFRTSKS